MELEQIDENIISILDMINEISINSGEWSYFHNERHTVILVLEFVK